MTASLAPTLRYMEGRNSYRKSQEMNGSLNGGPPIFSSEIFSSESPDWRKEPLEQAPFKALLSELLSRHDQLIQENTSLVEALPGQQRLQGEIRRSTGTVSSQGRTSQITLNSIEGLSAKWAAKPSNNSQHSKHSNRSKLSNNEHLTHQVIVPGDIVLQDDIGLESSQHHHDSSALAMKLNGIDEDDITEEAELAFVPDELYTDAPNGDWRADLAVSPNASILDESQPLQEEFKSRETTAYSDESELALAEAYKSIDNCLSSSFQGVHSCQVGEFADELNERPAVEADSVGNNSTTAGDIFPSWFITRQQRSSVSDMMEELYMDEEEDTKRCALSCTGRVRMIWDTIWCLILLYEIWATPFILVFMENNDDMPNWVAISETIIIIVFSLDILLNFFTGFIYKDKEILSLPDIAKNYLTGWFWLDIFATLPWDDIMISTTDVFSTTRSMKSLRAFKILKLFKLMRVVKAIQLFTHMKRKQAKTMKKSISLDKTQRSRSLTKSASRKQSSADGGYGLMSKRTSQGFEKNWFRRRCVKPCKRLWQRCGPDGSQIEKFRLELAAPILKGMFRIFMLVWILVLLAHINALLWALVKDQQDDWPPTADVTVGMERYWSCFWRVFSIMLGSPPAESESSTWLQVLEMLILIERLFLAWNALAYVLFQAFMMQEMSAHDSLRNKNALKYLRRHGASPSTQLQFLFNAQETGALRTSQRHFHELMHSVMPSELRRAILEELWCDRLLSLGLVLKVAQWRSDFVSELAQVVREETYASRVIITKEGDLAIAAYHILSGEVNVITTTQSAKIPPFTEGMWIGEKALVNPMLRRSGTVVTTVLSIVMTVPAQTFRTLLKDLGLKVSFENFCATELWKGLCGRCGSIGEHFGHECPTMLSRSDRGSARVDQRSSKEPDGERQDFSGLLAKDLRVFLERSRLERVQPALVSLRICSLDELLSADNLVEQLSDYLNITQAEAQVLSEENILNFRQTIKRSTIHMMESSGKYRHLLFLSHYKLEAGTEAALMRSDIEQALGMEDENDDQHQYESPVFLDSEDLTDLQEVMREVKSSEFLVLMLTKSVLTRPWCLLEIVTALKTGIPVLAVNIIKAGCEFEFPDESFYTKMTKGEVLGESGVKLLQDFGVQMSDVCHALRKVLQKIAVPYSPHRPLQIRQAELEVLLRQTRGSATVNS